MGCKNGRQIRTIGTIVSFPGHLSIPIQIINLPRELNNVNTNLDDEKKKTITDLIYSSFFLFRSRGEKE